jgi:protocatechuate 3,4-dioxygenase beta subunit
MHDDDVPVGRVLSRREVLASLGMAGVALALPKAVLDAGLARPIRLPGGTLLPACVVRPAQMEGPYFVDTKLDRPDIRSEPGDGAVKPGVPLRLAFQVSRLDSATCAPLAGALIDIWQCDGVGIYSGVKDINGMFDTSGRQFLRGHQVTDREGRVEFRTIYPGWYEGRTAHIHFKIRTDPGATRGTEFTSQINYDDAISDRVYAQAPYAANKQRRVRNAGDGIYRDGGAQLLLPLTAEGQGYGGRFEIGLQMG